MDGLLSLLFYLYFVGDDKGFEGFGDDLKLIDNLLDNNNKPKFTGIILFLIYIPLFFILFCLNSVSIY
jgi:hypothetical protein